MANGLLLFDQILPILLFPYASVTLSVLSYFMYKKYQVKIQIRNVPYSTIFDLDLDKVKKNLKIKSMVYNFVIALTMLEILAKLFSSVQQFLLIDLHVPVWHLVPNFDMQNKIISQGKKKDSIMTILNFSSEIPLSVIPTVICLFLIVLRRAFINLPYGNYVKGYSVYILVRVIVMLTLSNYLETQNILYMQLLPFFLIDIRAYISSYRSFYVLLKGRRDEAFYHSSRNDYLEKKVVANQFYHTQTFSHCALFILLLHYISHFYFGLIDFLLFGPFSIELFKDFLFQNYKFWNIIQCIFSYMNLIAINFISMYSFLTYLVVLVCIVVKLFIQRKKINHVNDWLTRPLMENYRASLDERTQQRPPFIQAIRSNQVY